MLVKGSMEPPWWQLQMDATTAIPFAFVASKGAQCATRNRRARQQTLLSLWCQKDTIFNNKLQSISY